MLSEDVDSRISGLSSLIGNTPLLCVEYSYKGKERCLYAKAENLNMTGSIKDRMAFYILQEGYKRGVLKPGDTIVEATSGNTGIAFSAIGRALGHPVLIFMPNWMSSEREDKSDKGTGCRDPPCFQGARRFYWEHPDGRGIFKG